MTFDESIRVIRPDDYDYEVRQERSDAQKMLDTIFDTATELITGGEGMIVAGLEMLAVADQGLAGKHRLIPTIIGQALIDLAEARRLRQ